jgi:hypothetical protein
MWTNAKQYSQPAPAAAAAADNNCNRPHIKLQNRQTDAHNMAQRHKIEEINFGANENQLQIIKLLVDKLWSIYQ